MASQGNGGGQSKKETEKNKKDQERNDKLIYLREDLIKRSDRISRDREMHRQRRKEEELTKEAVEVQDPAVRRNKDFVKNEYGLIDEAKDEQIRQNKIRQNLINAPEIQDLYKQLQVSYVRKQLQAQFDEKKMGEIKSSETLGSDYEEIQKAVKSEAEREEIRRRKETNKKLEYRKLLQDQIIDKYKLKQEEFRESLRERAVLEDAMRCTMEEDQMEVFRKRMMRDQIRKEIDEFRKAKALWTLREKEVQLEEDRKIKEYNVMKEKLENETKDNERTKWEQFQKKRILVYDIMSQKLDTRDEIERNVLLKCEEEEERKARKKEENASLKVVVDKLDLRNAFARQIEDKQERLRLQKQEEREYVKQKLKDYSEDKKCEEMTAEKRRRLKMAYKSAVLREIEEKRYRKRLEENKEIEERKLEEEAIEKKKKLIREERAIILNEHTGQLIGYLPPGFLKPSDLPHLPEQVKNYYTPTNQQQT